MVRLLLFGEVCELDELRTVDFVDHELVGLRKLLNDRLNVDVGVIWEQLSLDSFWPVLEPPFAICSHWQ
jgi:hypothetical protein